MKPSNATKFRVRRARWTSASSSTRSGILATIFELVEEQRVRCTRNLVAFDGLTLLALAIGTRLGRNEAHKLAQALLDGVLTVLGIFRVWQQRFLSGERRIVRVGN